MEPLLGADAHSEDSGRHNPQRDVGADLGGEIARSESHAAATEAGKEFGLSPRAERLRLAYGKSRFRIPHATPRNLRPDSDRESFAEALHSLYVSRNLLAFHAALARRESLDTLVGMRDAMASDVLSTSPNTRRRVERCWSTCPAPSAADQDEADLVRILANG